jgi:hypothetical protein
MLFFEIKKQETSADWGSRPAGATTPRSKSFFASFFTKKEVLSKTIAALPASP